MLGLEQDDRRTGEHDHQQRRGEQPGIEQPSRSLRHEDLRGHEEDEGDAAAMSSAVCSDRLGGAVSIVLIEIMCRVRSRRRRLRGESSAASGPMHRADTPYPPGIPDRLFGPRLFDEPGVPLQFGVDRLDRRGRRRRHILSGGDRDEPCRRPFRGCSWYDARSSGVSAPGRSRPVDAAASAAASAT